MNANEIQAELDKLAELRYALDSLNIAAASAVKSVIPPAMQAEIDKITESYGDATSDVSAEIEVITKTIKAATLALGEKVKGEALQAILVKGRASWNNAGLQGYAIANSDVLAFYSEGKPSVSIRKV